MDPCLLVATLGLAAALQRLAPVFRGQLHTQRKAELMSLAQELEEEFEDHKHGKKFFMKQADNLVDLWIGARKECERSMRGLKILDKDIRAKLGVKPRFYTYIKNLANCPPLAVRTPRLGSREQAFTTLPYAAPPTGRGPPWRAGLQGSGEEHLG
jgi:hypothetical protein